MAEKVVAVDFDAITGETVIRDLTADEIATRDLDSLASNQAQEQKLANRESALAKLAALGLTEAEIAAL